MTHRVSSILTGKTYIEKKKDPGAFTSPVAIGEFEISKALCDLGASINLMPLAIYKKLELRVLRPTMVRLQMADKNVRKPIGVVEDVMVGVDRFTIPADFIILDCEVDSEVPIILGRPFLTTGRALIDCESGDLTFRVNNEAVVFPIAPALKRQHDIGHVEVVDMIDDCIDEYGSDMLSDDALKLALITYGAESSDTGNSDSERVPPDIIETVNALKALPLEGHPTKLSLDLANLTTPPAEPSVEDGLRTFHVNGRRVKRYLG